MSGVDIMLGPLPVIVIFAAALGGAGFVARHAGPPPVPAGQRYVAIDGLRGLLATGVMAHHLVVIWFYLAAGAWRLPDSRFYDHLGMSSVALFFMISAFLFWDRVLARGPAISWLDLFVGRLYRLYPLYLLVFLAMVLATFASAGFALRVSPAALADGLLRWLLFTLPGSPDLNGHPDTGMLMAWVYWSLRYEWLFYIALPFFGVLFARSGTPVAGTLSGIAVVALIWWGNRGASTFQWNYLLCFAGGIAAAYAIRHPRLAALCRGSPAGCVALAALAAVIAFSPTAYAPAPLLGLTLFFIPVAAGNTLWGLLEGPATRWLGEISYGVYLMHGFIGWALLLRAAPPAIAADPLVYLGICVLLALLVVGAASAAFILVERPVMRLARPHAAWILARWPFARAVAGPPAEARRSGLER